MLIRLKDLASFTKRLSSVCFTGCLCIQDTRWETAAEALDTWLKDMPAPEGG